MRSAMKRRGGGDEGNSSAYCVVGIDAGSGWTVKSRQTGFNESTRSGSGDTPLGHSRDPDDFSSAV